MSPAQCVLRAAHAALAADAALIALLGGDHIHEHVPARARPPYLALAVPVIRDWSTATEDGAEVELIVTTYCETTRFWDLGAIQERVAAALTFEAVTVADHALVNLTPLQATTERRPRDELLVGTQGFRFVIEPQEQ